MKIVGSKQNLIGEYDNGNYHVMIYNDGTKIRQTDDDSFIPDFPECIDMMVTYECDGRCPYCYISSGDGGQHCDFHLYKPFLDSIRPYTEVAINGNDLKHPQLYEFLEYMKERNVIVNLTVNQKHFEKSLDMLHDIINKKLIHGLGVSLFEVTETFIEDVKSFNNIVVHIVVGVTSPLAVMKLRNRGLNVLILGYKKIGAGKMYYNVNHVDIEYNIMHMRDNIKSIIAGFNVASFDNLAIEQLDIKGALPKEYFEEIYMGDDGEFTFYVDLVKGKFARSSLEIEHDEYMHDLTDTMTIDDCFKIIKKENQI